MAAMRADGCNVLSHIFREMIDAGVKRDIEARKNKRQPKRDLVMSGFLQQLAKMFEPRDGGEFITDMDEAIDRADCLLRQTRECSNEIHQSIKYHIKKLQEFRERLSAKPSVTTGSL